LAAFISHQTIGSSLQPFVNNSAINNHPARTTLCYLTLPTRFVGDGLTYADIYHRRINKRWRLGDRLHVASSLFEFVDLATLPITDEQKGRFKKAMKILALEPFLRDIQIFSVDRQSSISLEMSVQLPRSSVLVGPQRFAPHDCRKERIHERVKGTFALHQVLFGPLMLFRM
jgi:hypothetical protein